ncbi:glycosyltransferase family 9 protein [Brumimicrobium salinarum]|uniref:glycosyltransferase family 9 protein n=1 Tax=Brumimicrobium salinarum TaxID=2058658 RepID=UPI001F0B89B0|nr:glycosyltransferase family 9 protein [Brumimicrobium salinarum]
MQRFLIIQTAFLGDVILATPVISELKRIYPEAMIDIVVRKGNESLLNNNPMIGNVFVWNKTKGKYKSLFETIKSIRKQTYTEVFTLQRFTNAGLMTFFAKSKRKIGFDKNAFSRMYTKTVPHSLLDGSHEVERNLRLIEHHQAHPLIRPSLFPSFSDFKAVSKYKGKTYFCLAPASVWETKKLPFHQWIKLIKILLNEDSKVYLLGGPNDFDLCKSLQNEFNGNVINLAGKLSLLQSAALMKDAKMNYVNDSGPLHIASAMNAPTRAFFAQLFQVLVLVRSLKILR